MVSVIPTSEAEAETPESEASPTAVAAAVVVANEAIHPP